MDIIYPEANKKDENKVNRSPGLNNTDIMGPDSLDLNTKDHTDGSPLIMEVDK